MYFAFKVVLIHGLGVGITPYLRFIRRALRQKGGRPEPMELMKCHEGPICFSEMGFLGLCPLSKVCLADLVNALPGT